MSLIDPEKQYYVRHVPPLPSVEVTERIDQFELTDFEREAYSRTSGTTAPDSLPIIGAPKKIRPGYYKR